MHTNTQISNFRDYRWGRLWVELKSVSPADQDASAFKAILLAAWWHDAEAAKQCIATWRGRYTPLKRFAVCLVHLCRGDHSQFKSTLALLRRQKAPAWIAHWLMLEYLGRGRQFTQQANYLNELLRTNYAQDNWPFVACLQSLEQTNVDTGPLLSVLERYPNLSSMAAVLGFRLEGAGNNQVCPLLDIPVADAAYLPAHYRLATFQVARGEIRKAISSYDLLAREGFIDKLLIRIWMSMCASHPAGWGDLPARVRFSVELTPSDKRFEGMAASYVLIHHWVCGRYAEAYTIAKQFQGFMENPGSDEDRNAHIFFVYVLRLALVWQQTPLLYNADGGRMKLSVIGESHSLSPANAIFSWLGDNVKAESRFVMGIKMYHLAQPGMNSYKACVIAQLDAAPAQSHLLFTIGEIDCRPQEGIWKNYQKGGRELNQIIAETVEGYVEWLLEELSSRRYASVTLQGIAAPGYELEGRLDPGDNLGFLAMVQAVNQYLKASALKAGWYFLDIYAATVGEGGVNNQIWSLDGFHSNPRFYLEADKWIVGFKQY